MAIYYVDSTATGSGTGADWANAFLSFDACFTAVTLTGGDTVYFAHDHANTAYGVAKTWNIPETFSGYLPIYLLSVTRGTTTLQAGAIERASGFGITLAGNLYAYGITLDTGSTTSSAVLTIGVYGGQTSNIVLDKMLLINGSTNTASRITLGGMNYARSDAIVINSAFKFSNTASFIETTGKVNLVNCSLVGSTYPINLFNAITNSARTVTCSACNFTGITNIAAGGYPGTIKLNNCITPLASNQPTGQGVAQVEATGCGTSTDDVNYHYFYKDGLVTITEDTGVFLTTGGASFTGTDGVAVKMSLKMVANSECAKYAIAKTPWFNVEVPSTGSKTFSVKIANTVAALKDTEVWLELEYMADSTNPMTTNVIDAPVVSGTNSLNILAAGTNRTDTAEAWTGITGEVTHTLSKTVTVNQIGWARARVCLAKASTTIYVDPQATVV